MKATKMILAKLACEEDSKEIFLWRNDKLSREMSLTTDIVLGKDIKCGLSNCLKLKSFTHYVLAHRN